MGILDRSNQLSRQILLDDPAFVKSLDAHIAGAIKLCKEIERRMASLQNGGVVTSPDRAMILQGLLAAMHGAIMTPVRALPLEVARAGLAQAIVEEDGASIRSALSVVKGPSAPPTSD